MGDLESREVLLPPDLVPCSSHEVVVVPASHQTDTTIPISHSAGTRSEKDDAHEDVNDEVRDDGDPGDRRPAVELGVAEEGGRSVVEHMEELEGLLLYDEEHCVDQLPAARSSRQSHSRIRGSSPGSLFELHPGKGQLSSFTFSDERGSDARSS